MEKLIEFKSTNFAYDASNAFNDFNMEIMESEIITLIGPSGSGKTTLLKMLVHKLPNDSVYYKGIPIKQSNIDEIRNNVVVVFDSGIISRSVEEEIKRFARKIKLKESDIDERYYELDKTFNIDRISKIDPKRLSHEEEYLVKILRYLIIKPKFMAIDNILSNLSKNDIRLFFNFVKKNKMAVLNVTTDLDLSLYGDKLYVLENFVLIMEGNTLSVLQTDTLLKRLGFKLPLAVDLSIELGHYDVLKKIYTERDKLVNALWK
ncbi:MAG TPA: hypothetical protein DCY94_03305 [Firmicutes bacterium]|nr:hypothetical protein [Bacillota bacterium]